MKKFMLFIMLISCLLGACNQDTAKSSQASLTSESSYKDQNKINDVKAELKKMEEVIDVQAIVYDQKIYADPKVKQFSRFRLKEIRKNGFEKLKKTFPDSEIHVSTDKKVYMELEKLEQQLKNGKIKNEDLEKKLQKIEEMMKG
ncbi:YhcN/YlaJ family sporulation lipoprotein [Alkalihalobacillus trypoxylicola]|uniref:Sporulation protein n=1 Tax=Alkalihalobacillus trypoxylicola TaxID=519424 RepID=A0A162ELC2_9BACI|nr:YhcN/YlaJ family sporulation lipoprotein [Alkalihalobacillus trypoxylicola]KYG33169.1 hypothetical protein AZF04_17650 [Alkalihalobacillus trypoxylicola]